MTEITKKYSEKIVHKLVAELLNEIEKQGLEIKKLNHEIFEITETAIEYSRKGIRLHSQKN